MLIKRFLSLFLLLALPTLAMQQMHMQRGLQSLLKPQLKVRHHAVCKGSSKPWTSKTFKYDDILTLLTDLESGALERRCTDQDLAQINYFLADLAREGLIPNCSDPYELEQDIEELLGITDPHSFRYVPAERSSYELTPAIYYGGYETQACGWFSKAWKKTKMFCKKHKKAIIIGAVVVVVATVVVVAVVAAPAAGGGAVAGAAGGAAEGGGAAGGLAAGGAAAVNGSKKSDDDKPSTTSGVNQAVASRPDASPPKGPSGGGKLKSPPPKIEQIVEKHCNNFKEAVAEERPVVSHDKPEMRLPFEEATRVHGAFAAREAVTEVVDSLGAVGLETQNQSLTEVDRAFSMDSASIAPVGAALAAGRIPGGPAVKATAAVGAMAAVVAFPEETQKAYNTISDGVGYVCDKAIECVRDAGEYVQEWVNGSVWAPEDVIPNDHYVVPEERIQEGLTAGEMPDRGERTRAGRSIEKHGYRGGSAYPRPSGNAEEINRQGRGVLEEILRDPDAEVRPNEIGGEDITASDGRTVRFRPDGEFVGFREPIPKEGS